MSTAQALFGDDTWFALANTILQQEAAPTNATMLAYWDLICHYMPLRNAIYFASSRFSAFCPPPGTAPPNLYHIDTFADGLAYIVRDFLYIFADPYKAEAALNTGAFFANNYTLAQALVAAGVGDANKSTVYSWDGLQTDPVVPVLSHRATIAISVLVALQAVVVLLLLLYIYTRRVWTRSLDALAIATLGAQLAELHIRDGGGSASGPLGVLVVPEARRQRLWKMDGAINPKIVHRNTGPSAAEDIEMTALPPPYAPRGHRPASGEVRSTEAGLEADERPGSAPPYTPPEGEGEVVRQASRRDELEETSRVEERSWSPV